MSRPSLHLVDPRRADRTRLRERLLAVAVGALLAAGAAVPFALSLAR